MMIMKYKFLFNNGIKEEFTQEGTEKEMSEVHQVIYESFANGVNAVVTFGDGENSGRFIRLSDVSQFEMQLIDEDSNIIDSN